MVEWSCTNKINKLMRTLTFGRVVVYIKNKSVWTLIFGRIVVHKRNNKLKKAIYFCRMVVYKKRKEISADPNFWLNSRAQKKD